MERLVAPQGTFVLARHPVRPNETLRAWDAADEYLLDAVADRSDGSGSRGATVIVNDGSGALTVALARLGPSMVSDSYVAQLAARHNLEANRIDPSAVVLLGSFDPLPDRVDLLLVKVPKSLALLDDQLRRVRPHLHEGSVVIGAAMAKHLHTSSLEVFERRIGPTTTSLARKKARLVHSQVGDDPDLADPGLARYLVDPDDHVVLSHPGVFSADHLDIGTRFFLEHLPSDRNGGRVVDLGCGNGVVGMMAAVGDPDVEVTFVDESHRAVASAEATFRANLGPDRVARFVVGNGLAELSAGPPVADGSIDRVLNNPPFHVDQAVGDAVAWQMFSESRSALRPGGDLWVVGNRHLAYHAKLKRLFGNCDVVASNAKFVVLSAVRT
ncbi:MAG: methyltransferase [Acidimicrobiales bacterium]